MTPGMRRPPATPTGEADEFSRCVGVQGDRTTPVHRARLLYTELDLILDGRPCLIPRGWLEDGLAVLYEQPDADHLAGEGAP